MPVADSLSNTTRSSTIELAESIEIQQLYRLMEAYTKRLKSKSALWSSQNSESESVSLSTTGLFGKQPTAARLIDTRLLKDVEFLSNQLGRLIDKASAIREAMQLDEINEMEIELYLFDSEEVLSTANRILARQGVKPNRPLRRRVT